MCFSSKKAAGVPFILDPLEGTESNVHFASELPASIKPS